jgi:hypothetical protein
MSRRFLTLVIVLAAYLITPASAADLSQYCGHAIESRNITLIGKPLDSSTCTANCFRFTLTCNNGRRFSLSSRYTPYDPDWLHWFTEMYPIPQLIFLAVVAFGAFVMSQGHARQPLLNLAYVGLVAIAMFFWPAMATHGPYSAEADFETMGSGFAILGLPVFLLLNLPALMRGWNYLFVQHPAEPIVGPALRTGSSIDTKRLATTLREGAYDMSRHPQYHYENQAAKALAMRDKIEAARAEVAAAERALEEAKRRAEYR